MCTIRKSGDRMYLFVSLDRFYIWDESNHAVLLIQQPNTELDILERIKTVGLQGLSTQKIKAVQNSNLL